MYIHLSITEKTEAYELDIKTNRPKSTNPLVTKSLHHHRHAHGHLFSHILEPLVEQDTVRRHSIDTSPRLSAVGSWYRALREVKCAHSDTFHMLGTFLSKIRIPVSTVLSALCCICFRWNGDNAAEWLCLMSEYDAIV